MIKSSQNSQGGLKYMITISLDEAGVFEKNYNQTGNYSKTTLIGGILFDDLNNDVEISNEMKRIQAYYISVINQANENKKGLEAKYPQDLHYKNMANADKVKYVKDTVRKTLPEFLKNGTFNSKQLLYDGSTLPERKGKYRICAIVKSAQGKSKLLKDSNGSFFNDKVGANTYYHMVSETVEHLIFHNPLINYDDGTVEFNLDIATRLSSYLDDDKAEEYEKLGMIDNKAPYLREGTHQYSIMNSDVFRTILTEQMLEEPEQEIQVSSFKVRSISYKEDDTGNIDQVFLYLADSICSYLTFEIKANDIHTVNERARELTGTKNLIFAYDEVDLYFKRAWKFYEMGEYYDALNNAYSITMLKGKEATIYREYWVDYIGQMIISDIDKEIACGRTPYAFIECLDELRSSYMSNKLNPGAGEYIFKVLEKASKDIKANGQYQRILYQLNDIGVLVNCHKGNLKGAKPYFKKCEKYAGAVDLEEYTRTRNRYTNALLDSFEYAEAIGVIRITLELLGGLYRLSREKLGRRAVQFGKIEYAKTLSQAGQAAAYLRDKEALGFFDDALALMKDNPANRKITESYRLHYLIEANECDLYLEGMIEYTEGYNTLEGQLNAIKILSERGDINSSFAFYLFTKGLNTFYSTEEIKGIWNKTLEFEKDIDDNRKNSHPWELLYKYLGLLAIKVGDEKYAEGCLKKIVSSTEKNKDSLVSSIGLFSEAELADALGKTVRAKNIYTHLLRLINEEYPKLNIELDEITKFKDKKDFIKNIFTYMYC